MLQALKSKWHATSVRRVSIKIRISFNRDGTLVSPPRLLVPAPTAKQQALMESAVDALERCQPFTMLPAEKYKQWKTMVVYVTPLFAHWCGKSMSETGQCFKRLSRSGTRQARARARSD